MARGRVAATPTTGGRGRVVGSPVGGPADPNLPPFSVIGLDSKKWEKRTTKLGLDYWYNSDDPYYRYIVGDWAGEYKRISWTLIENPTGGGTPRGKTTRDTEVSQEARELTSLAVGKIPACYGQTRVGPLIFLAGNYNGATVLGGALCHGSDQGIGGVVSVLLPRANQAGVYDSVPQNGVGFQSAIQWTPYLGTLTQLADPVLTAILNLAGTIPAPDFAAQRHPGLAYLSLVLTKNDTWAPSLPLLKILLNGRKVYDPRLDATLVSSGVPTRSATTVVYSNNAALVLADYLQDEWFGCRYGMLGVDWIAAALEADYCDVLVAGEKRHTINIALQRPALHQANVDTLRAHFRADVVPRNGKQAIVCDRAKASTFTFDSSNSRLARVNRKGPSEIPNGLRLSWVNPSKDWNDDEAKVESDEVKNGIEEWVPEDYSLDGCTAGGEAERQKFYLYNKKTVSEALEVEIIATTLEGGLQAEVLDHVTLNDDLVSLAPVELTVVSKQDATEGEARLSCVAYVPAIFSDATAIVETKRLTLQDDPTAALAAPTGLLLVEEPYRVQGSNITRSRVRISYTLNTSKFADGVKITVQRAGQNPYILVPKGDAGPYYIVDADDNALYTVTVQTINGVTGATGTASIQTLLTQTKTLPPSDVTQAMATPYNGQVLLECQQPYDIDLEGYEWRRISESEVGAKTLDQQWTAATFVKSTWDSSLLDAPPWANAWRYLVKAYDSGGRYSTNPAYAVITLEPPRPIETFTLKLETYVINTAPAHGTWSRRNVLASIEKYADGTERVLMCRQKTFDQIQAEIDAAFGTSGTIAQWAATHPGPLCFPLPLDASGTASDYIKNAGIFGTGIIMGRSRRNREFRVYGKSSTRLGSNSPAIIAKARAARILLTAPFTPRFTIDTEGANGGMDSSQVFGYVLSTNNANAQEMVDNIGAPSTPLITYQVQKLSVPIQSGTVTTDSNGLATVTFTTPLLVDGFFPVTPVIRLVAQNALNPTDFAHVALTAVSETGFSIQTFFRPSATTWTIAPAVTVYYAATDDGVGGSSTVIIIS